MPTTLHENRPSAGIGVVEVQKLMVFPISNMPARPSAGIGVVEVQKPMVFFAISNMPARPSAGIGVVEVQKLVVFCDFCGARATLCGDRRGRGAKTHGFLRFPTCPRDPLRGSAWSRCKNSWFFAISAVPARPSAGIGLVEVQKPMVFCEFQHARATLCGDRRGRGAKTRGFFAISAVFAQPCAGIGVVEVQKPMVSCDFQHARATLCGDRRGRGAKTHGFFCDFCGARATLCGDRRGRGAKTRGFFAISAVFAQPCAGIGVVEVQKPMVSCDFQHARATLCGDRRGRGAKTRGFLRFLRCPRDPLRGSAWSRCKNPWFFAISNMPARPSAGIGVVEVQKLEVFCDFYGARATLCGNRRGGGKLEVFCDFCCSNWSSGVVSWFARLLPEPAGRGFDSSLVRGRASQDATCILKQLEQSNLRRASCTEQLAQTNLHRPVCAERLA